MKPVAVVLFLLSLATFTAAQTESTELSVSKDHPPKVKVRKVFANVTGDPKLAKRMWKLLDLELDDRGIELVSGESAADAVINVEVGTSTAHKNLYVGTEKIEYLDGSHAADQKCASSSNGADSELYSGGASDSIVKTIVEKFPAARTFSLDESSDLGASKKFKSELLAALTSQGLRQVAGKADVPLKISLATIQVPIEVQQRTYKAELRPGSSGFPSTYSCNGAVSTTLIGTAPAACPGNFGDLSWNNAQNDVLAVFAAKVAKDLSTK